MWIYSISVEAGSLTERILQDPLKQEEKWWRETAFSYIQDLLVLRTTAASVVTHAQ